MTTSLLKQPVAYMTTTEGPGAMSNFMGFPHTPLLGHPPYFAGNINRGRAGEPISPFFVPANPTYALPEFPGYSPDRYGNVPFSDSKPVVCEPQEIAVNALLALHSKQSTGSGNTSPQSGTPTMTSRTFSDESTPDLITALRMSTSAYPPGDSITGFDVPRTTSLCLADGHYPPDVKPIIPVPNYVNGGSPVASTTSITSPLSGQCDRSPSCKPRTKAPHKSGNNICQICGKSYARPSTLKTHMRTHSGEKPYKCDVCGKAFTQAANLTAHLRTHSGEKPFSCPICQKRFSQSSSVTTHLRTHSGERPYRCDYCGKAFADTSTLTKHKRIHSGEKPYRCKICNLGFSQSGNLHRHMKTHNN